MEQVQPEVVGLAAERLARIQPVMQGYVDQNKLAGLITLLARRGKLAHFDCYGMQDVEAGKAMQRDALFQIQSLTKPVTCVAALLLYEAGQFRLNDAVSNFIPEFKGLRVLARAANAGLELADLEREITIHDLLTHTSGLSYASQTNAALAALHQEVNVGSADRSLRERVQKLLQLPLAHQPGRAWRYGFSHDVLAHVVELISGLSFDAFLRQRIFEPLGMADTGFYVPEENAGRLTAVYGPAEDGGLELVEAPATSGLSDPGRPPFGGTGLVSTPRDFLCFAQLLLDGGELDGARLLSRKTIELMTTNHLPDDVLPSFYIVQHDRGVYTRGYGFGLGVRVRLAAGHNELPGSPGEYGWVGIMNTYFWVDPREALIGLVWTQSTHPLHTHPLERQFKVLAYQALAA